MTTTRKDTPFQLVASDLDGTLLAPDHKLSAFSKQTLKDLHDKGFTFIFATGRHHIDVAGIREQVGIPAYMVTSNGARVHDQNDKLMYSNNVPMDLVKQVVDTLKEASEVFIHIYRNDDWMLDRDDEFLRNYHQDSGFSYTLFDVENPPVDGVAKLFFTHPEQDHDYLVKYEEILNQKFGDQLNIAFSTPWCLEVMAAEVSKGDAIKVIADSLGLQLDNCISFGDGMNDVEMLEVTGRGLIMGTSQQRLKDRLPNHQVIGSNEDDAVAHYLQDHLL